MSKKIKLDARKRRRMQKATRKAAQKAQYEAWKAAGQNSKSKRAKLNGKRSNRFGSTDHPNGPCGNVGCRKCNPVEANLLTPIQLHILRTAA